MQDTTTELVQKALGGDAEALRKVLGVITPAIQSSVDRTVRRSLPASVRSTVRHEVEDLTQDVLFAFFDRKGRRLAAYRPEKGLSLSRYAELVASRLAISVLRSRRRSPWSAEPVSHEELDRVTAALPCPERELAQRQVRESMIAGVSAELRPRGRELLQLLVVEQLPTEEVCARTGLSRNAVHVWRARIVRIAQDVARRRLRDETRPRA